MTTLQLERLSKNNRIEQDDLVDISKIIVNLFSVKSSKISIKSANKKEEVIDAFSLLIEKTLKASNSEEDKLC